MKIGIRQYVFKNMMREPLTMEEAKKKKPYKCSNGHLTVGIGHNLDQPMTDELINLIFNHDLRVAMREVKRLDALRRDIHWRKLPLNAKIVLVDMNFQLGLTRLRKFKKMLRAIGEGDWKKAHDECLNSKYARSDSPNRAKRNAELLKSCQKRTG